MKLFTAEEYYDLHQDMPRNNHVMVAGDGEWLGDVSQSDHDPQYWTIIAIKDHGDLISFACPLSSIYEIFEANFPGQ